MTYIEFEVINIEKKSNSFTVEIKIKSTEEKRTFGYPSESYWTELIDNIPRFLIDIQTKVHDEFLADTSEVEFKEYIGKKYKVEKKDKIESPILSSAGSQCSKGE